MLRLTQRAVKASGRLLFSRATSSHTQPTKAHGKVLIALYPDPKHFPPAYIRDSIPDVKVYPDGMTAPTPKARNFIPGQLLGSVSGELGLRSFLEANGFELIVTSDFDEMDKHLGEAEYIISQPFYPYYLTDERMGKAPRLKAAITAGVGSDHVDLHAAIKRHIDVCEVTYCNSVSVAEHTVMMILGLARNYIRSHDIVCKEGGWNIADCVQKAYDIEGMHIGTVAAGRIGLGVLRRLHAFGCKLHYTERHRLPKEVEQELGLVYHADPSSMMPHLDVLSIHCPLHPETTHLIDDMMLSRCKKGLFVVNNARAEVCDRDAIVRALDAGKLGGYAGDVWYPQPPPKSHPWRTMPHNAMTPHTSGTTLSAQTRYADGVREILEHLIAGKKIREEYQIVTKGKLVGMGKYSYS